MGMCLGEHGAVSIEVRRESFVVHASYGYRGTTEASPRESWEKRWVDEPHPEFPLEDLDNLIGALQEARAYLVQTRGGVW